MTASARLPGIAPPPTETELLRSILVALCQRYPRGLFVRRNVGLGVTATKQVVRFGLPGMADLEGCVDGRHVEVEVKTAKGRQTEPQRRWQAAVERAGGVYVIARSPEHAIASIEAALAAPARSAA